MKEFKGRVAVITGAASGIGRGIAERCVSEGMKVVLAGIGAGGSPWEATWNDWEWVIGVHLWGVIHGVKIFTPLMFSQNVECHIVNTASTAGLVVGGGLAPYSATKHAAVALSAVEKRV